MYKENYFSIRENIFYLYSLRKFFPTINGSLIVHKNPFIDYDASDEMNLDKRKQMVDAKLPWYQNRCKIFEERTDEAYKHFEDQEHGEWFGYVHRDGRLSSQIKGNLWKGPFHLPRMQLVCWRLLEDGTP